MNASAKYSFESLRSFFGARLAGIQGKKAIARIGAATTLPRVTFPRQLLLLALPALVLFPGCQRKPEQAAETPRPTPAAAAIAIGFFAPISGAQASYGVDSSNGARLAVDEINAAGGVLGKPLSLVVKDTRSLAAESVDAIKSLIKDDKVVAVIGEIASDRSLAAAAVAQEQGVPMITPSATSAGVTATGDFIFRACYTDVFQAAVMAKFARSIDVRKAAIFSDQSNPYGNGLAAIFKKDFVDHGGEIVAEESYRAGDTEFSLQLATIKSKAPEIIFLPSYYTEAALIIRQARKVGIDVPFLGTDGWDSQEFLKVGGNAVDNCYFSSHFSSERTSDNVKRFSSAYSTKHAVEAPPLAALAYDAVFLVADAIKRAGVAEPRAIRDALATTKDFQGVTGMITFDANRNPRKSGIVLRSEGGKFSYLETTDP